MCPLRGQSLESRLAAQRSVRQAAELKSDTADASKTCPSCRLISPASADMCECGWSFTQGRRTERSGSRAIAPPGEWAWMLIVSALLGLAGPAIPLSNMPVGFIMGSMLFGEVGHGGFWYWFVGPGGWPLWIGWAAYTSLAYLAITGITRFRDRSR